MGVREQRVKNHAAGGGEAWSIGRGAMADPSFDTVVFFEPDPDRTHMRLVHSSPSFTTTTTRTTSTKTTTATATPFPPHPIPILITTAPQTPSPATTPRLSSSSTPDSTTDASNRARKRLAPGLQARLQRLEERNKQTEATARCRYSIGRIPEEQLAEIEHLQHRRPDHEPSRVKAGRARPWAASAMPVAGGVRLSGGPVWTDNEASMPESGDDFSSVIDISEDLAGDTTEDDEALYLDKHKYRIPSPGKTRLHLHTKEPLSPSPRPVVGMRPSSPPNHARSNLPPTPPPKMDSARPSHWRTMSADTVSDGEWSSTGISRAGSIYSLSRVSFSGQLSQLTSMRLPDADSLSKRILSMSTAIEAARALSDAAEQIRMWIGKALEVLGKLDAEDDVEWAAAGGQEGIEDVDEAIKRFEQLVDVYVLSIERLQTRADISQLPPADQLAVVRQMEHIVVSWQKIKDTLQGVKDQTEMAIDWMRLWNSVLGEIGQEMDSLNDLVFEMEEKRHSNAESLLTSRDSIGIDELETIVEDHPGRLKISATGSNKNNRLSIPTFFPSSPTQAPAVDKEDSSLLALFARMQPLRASLDFLPMQLSGFQVRAGDTFPTACDDLTQRQERLEMQWNKLQADADSLRRELGEDKWVLVFRNAGRQALKMCESITRSYSKLRDAVDFGEHQTNIPSIIKKVENYEAKKTHYGPAIERVLSIIDRGVHDRLTVNGEILRLQSDMRQRWTSLQAEMRDIDRMVEDLTHHTRDKELRDSVSTVVSSERSVNSSLVETPNSSPASSVLGHSRRNSLHGARTPTGLTTVQVRTGSNSTTASKPRLSTSSLPRRSLLPRASRGNSLSSSPVTSTSSARTPSKSSTTSTPVSWPASSRPDLQPSSRPRWNSAVRSDQTRDFRPLAACEPSPYAKPPSTPKSTFLRSTPKPSPHSASTTPQPPIPATSTTATTTANPTRNITSPSSIPRPTAYKHTSTSTSPLQNRHVSLSSSLGPSTTSGASSSVYTPSKNLGTRSSQPTLRPGSRLSSGGQHRKPRIFRDGNDADTESSGPPSHGGAARARPPSVLGGGSGSGGGGGNGARHVSMTHHATPGTAATATATSTQAKRSSSLFSATRLKLRGSMEFLTSGISGGPAVAPAAPTGSQSGANDGKPRWRV